MQAKKLKITTCNECKHSFEAMDDYYRCGLKNLDVNLSKIHKECPLEDY